eukprot:gb/GECG01013579.1/.p1 GENE.gb/GECG01013579.1/~~gb/GECG01013579.1/.p1  ORF type:complete len:117 (+),score=12.36 gb/GECG01013579.1/:1-351(+)
MHDAVHIEWLESENNPELISADEVTYWESSVAAHISVQSLVCQADISEVSTSHNFRYFSIRPEEFRRLSERVQSLRDESRATNQRGYLREQFLEFDSHSRRTRHRGEGKPRATTVT